ncbi:MAG: hypothetical protein R8N50_02490 [Alphaproteobacteria bacterium]|nr:hypothetical protein [Alphaproteobacteria bacterium]
MKSKLNNFLLATLWLLVSTLATCFWFNIRFGFNIFSSAHWQHLAYMQATQNPITPTFYISIVISVIVVILGLYLFIRPNTKHVVKLASPSPAVIDSPRPTPNIPAPPPTPQPYNGNLATNQPTMTQPDPGFTRPPRLNLTSTPQLFTPPSTPSATTPPPSDWPELREIFESAGYTTKPTFRINGTPIPLLAIGNNEVLWIGAVGIPTSTLDKAIEVINQIFSDTLDDLIININGFVLYSPDASSPGASNILTFDTPESLRQYISTHPNPPTAPDDIENFDAFSAYISTVIEYIGTI